MEVLITGANGYVGTILSNCLQRDGVSIRRAVRHKQDGAKADIHVGVLNGETDWTEALQCCWAVVHLAAIAHVRGGRQNATPHEIMEANYLGTINLAQQAASAGVRRFIFMSSIGVNGAETTVRPFSEIDSPHPESIYAESKLKAENRLRQLSRSTGMQIVIIRSPMIYGEGAPGNFSRLVRLIRSGIPLPFDGLTNYRSMIYIENIVDFIRICIRHPIRETRTFVVSDDADLQLREIIEIIAKGLGDRPKLYKMPKWILNRLFRLLGGSRVSQQMLSNLQVDISLSKKLLGWSPPVDVRTALRRTATWYRDEVQ